MKLNRTIRIREAALDKVLGTAELTIAEILDRELYLPIKAEIEQHNIDSSLGIKKELFKTRIEQIFKDLKDALLITTLSTDILIRDIDALATAARTYVQIKSLYEDYYNTNQDTNVFAEEYYYAVGEILSGKSIKDLKLEFLTDYNQKTDKDTIGNIAQKWLDEVKKEG